MNLKSIVIEGEGTILAADNGVPDFASFLDPKKNFLLIKKTIDGWLYLLLFDKLENGKYSLRSGSKYDESRSADISFPECKKILKF